VSENKKIWVVLQQRDGALHRLSSETVVAGQKLAAAIGGSVEVVLLGSGIGGLADELAGRLGVAVFHVADHEALEPYTPGAYIGALAPAVRAAAPAYVLFPHTYQSMDYFPRLAQQVEGSLVSGVGGFEGSGTDILWHRPVLGGKLQAKVRITGSGPALISVQSGAFSADEATAGSVALTPLTVEGIAKDRELLGVEQAGEEEVDLSKASIIVAAGRGVGGADKMAVIKNLAAALGADIGASRPVIDNGWLPRDRQIGSSGQTVAPKLYVAVGISGAIQHLVGMKGSGCVVAINKDANAPIFSVADYGIVGDLHEILPALTAAIQGGK
jgi:electron transfer flavoprotein alpha subunit